MRWIAGFLPIIAAAGLNSAFAADVGLAPLSASLSKVRATHGVNEMRDAGPELTLVKRQIREWIEGALPPEKKPSDPDGFVELPSAVDLRALSDRLNKALRENGLTCGDWGSLRNPCAGKPGTDESERGFVGDVRLSTVDFGRYLVVTTAVGIRCGYDESAYVYRRDKDRRWKLLFQSEQDNYGVDDYKPQIILSVDASPSGAAWNEPSAPPLILTLGQFPWCSSNWQTLYTRLWRASEATATPRPLLDTHDTLYIGNDTIASARLTGRDALIEFQGQSLDGGVLIRPHVVHYFIGDGDKLERIAPVALSPNDFVEEWLTSSWSQASAWLDVRATNVVSGKIHASLSADFGEFDGPATRCRSEPTLWQVSFAATDESSKDYRLKPPKHFLIRWMAPYRFSLVAIGKRPFFGCDQKVAMPDDPGTLFPVTAGKE